MNRWPAEAHAAQLRYRSILGLKQPSSGWFKEYRPKQRSFKWSKQNQEDKLLNDCKIVIQWFDGDTRKGGITVTKAKIADALDALSFNTEYVTISTLTVQRSVLQRILNEIEEEANQEAKRESEDAKKQSELMKNLQQERHQFLHANLDDDNRVKVALIGSQTQTLGYLSNKDDKLTFTPKDESKEAKTFDNPHIVKVQLENDTLVVVSKTGTFFSAGNGIEPLTERFEFHFHKDTTDKLRRILSFVTNK